MTTMRRIAKSAVFWLIVVTVGIYVACNSPGDFDIGLPAVLSANNSFYAQPTPSNTRINQIQIKGSSYSNAPKKSSLEFQLEHQKIRYLELRLHRTQPGVWVSEEPGAPCTRLEECLSEISTWSRQDDEHAPLFVAVGGTLAGAQTDGTALSDLADTILKVWPRNNILAPADASKLAEPPQWPLIEQAASKVLLVLDSLDATTRDAYLNGVPKEKALFFVVGEAQTNMPAAARIAYIDNPVGNENRIATLVSQGFLVRTKADEAQQLTGPSDALQARLNAALASGAQIVLSERPCPIESSSVSVGTYCMSFPQDDMSQCDALNAPEDCTQDQIE